jgi:hypothetical protein
MKILKNLKNEKLLTAIAISLILLSGLFFGMIFVIPFFPLSLTTKGVLVTASIISGEIAWWVGVAIAGKQVITKYRHYLNPRNWFRRKNETG